MLLSPKLDVCTCLSPCRQPLPLPLSIPFSHSMHIIRSSPFPTLTSHEPPIDLELEPIDGKRTPRGETWAGWISIDKPVFKRENEGSKSAGDFFQNF